MPYIAFCFDNIPQRLADIASISPNLQAVGQSEAILKCELANWKELDCDQDITNNLWSNGKFALVDFANLAKYLAKKSPSQLEHHTNSPVSSFMENNDE